MRKPEVKPQHIGTATFQATKKAMIEAAAKGRVKIETLTIFASLFEDESERTEFLSNLYESSPARQKMEIEEICTTKDWQLNKNEED